MESNIHLASTRSLNAMESQIFKYLRDYTTEPNKINRLIVSAFLHSHGIKSTKNEQLSSLYINSTDSDYLRLKEFIKIQTLTSFEELIELFEFVISPADKIINGAVYTPLFIREHIIEETIRNHDRVDELTICDPACGCSGFLYNVAKRIKSSTEKSYKEIFETNIFGLDIEGYSVERSKILLSLLAIVEGEDHEKINFNLHEGNALSFDWKNVITRFSGFDIIVGNPPYVCSRNMDQRSLDLIYNWEVSKSGHPDLYIPFFQLGIENLKSGGTLGYITVNTFLKSVNGRALREYFSRRKIELRIINFGGEQVFQNRNTYTCLCFVTNHEGGISYRKVESSFIDDILHEDLNSYEYDELNDFDGWNLVNALGDREFIDVVENVGEPFKNKYTTRNGIATLKNHIYKFVPVDSTENTYTLRTKSGRLYQIEQSICKEIINANKITCPDDLEMNSEQIIFPYNRLDGVSTIMEEDEMVEHFPLTYNYLLDHKEELATRDKGKKQYEKWYAYGRRQSLDINSPKLFFPHISERPSFVISENHDLLFYNGIAVISNDLAELRLLKVIMESDVFFRYIKCTTKDYASGYISMSKNYIKNFGIPHFCEDEKNELLESDNPDIILERWYSRNGRVEEDTNTDLIAVAEPKEFYGE